MQGDLREIAAAARHLVVRGRREASGVFAGAYRSAFRGGGIEFEESRPYTPGDDVRSIDWNATARTGEPYVKRFREERDQTLVLAVDGSGSMAFGRVGRSKARHAAHAAALLAIAAGRARDRVGLVTFSQRVQDRMPPGRGDSHVWALVRAMLTTADAAGGTTRLPAALEAASGLAGRRAVLFLLSDLRGCEDEEGEDFAALRAAAQRHELVVGIVSDPLEEALPRGGPLRVADPERPGRAILLDASSRRVRTRYAAACAARRAALERGLGRAGIDAVWLSTRTSPVLSLARFFRQRSGRVRLAS